MSIFVATKYLVRRVAGKNHGTNVHKLHAEMVSGQHGRVALSYNGCRWSQRWGLSRVIAPDILIVSWTHYIYISIIFISSDTSSTCCVCTNSIAIRLIAKKDSILSQNRSSASKAGYIPATTTHLTKRQHFLLMEALEKDTNLNRWWINEELHLINHNKAYIFIYEISLKSEPSLCEWFGNNFFCIPWVATTLPENVV